MASTYTAAGIELVTQGEQAGAWGDTTNTNWEMMEEMVGGVVSVALSTTSETLTTSDGASSDGRHAAIVFTGSPGGTCTVTVSPNDMQKIYFVVNNSDQTVTLSQGSGANVSIAAGSKKIVYCDGAGAGAAVVDITTNLDISGLHIDGVEVTATAAELNYVDATSSIQTQLDAKQAAATAVTTSTSFGGDVSGTYDAIVVADDSHNHIISNVDGLQTALDAKAALAGATFTGAVIGTDLTLSGDLTVNGTTTTVNTTNTVVSDALIELANGTTGAPANDAGLVIERGDSNNAFIGFDESADKFIVGTGTFTGASTGDLTITTGTLVANIEGNVTGAVTGNADTATTLETARTIGGVSFNGSANIDLPGVNTTGNQDTSGNAATATKWATGRTITLTGDVTGTSGTFDGSGNLSFATTIAADSVALGTDTTGNYMADVSAGTGIGVSHTPAEGSTATVSLSHLGIESLTDPNADRIMFWDDSAGAMAWLSAGTNITISGTTISSTDTDTTYSAGAGLDLSTTTFSVESDLRGDVYYIGQDTNDYYYVGTTTHDWYLDGNMDMRLENDGDLHVDGNVVAYSTTTSDPRLKDNIQKVEGALEKVEKLTGYTFTYKVDGRESAGILSTEVKEVLPSAVRSTTLPLKSPNGEDDPTEYDVVQYDQLHAVLIEAVKELSAKVKELEAKLV